MSSTQALPKPPHSGVDVPFAPSFVPPFPEGNSQIHPSAHLLPSMKLPGQFESSIEPTISFLSTALNWERLIYQERSKTRYLENLVCGLRIQLQEEKVHSAAKDSKLKEFEQELKRLSLVVDSAAKAHQLKELEEDLQRAFNDQDVTDHQSPQNTEKTPTTAGSYKSATFSPTSALPPMKLFPATKRKADIPVVGPSPKRRVMRTLLMKGPRDPLSPDDIQSPATPKVRDPFKMDW